MTNARRTIALGLVAPLALLVATAGCDVEDMYDRNLGVEVGQIVKLEGGLVARQVDPDRLLYLRVTQEGLDVEEIYSVPEEREILYMIGGPDTSAPTHLFVLTVPKDERQTDVHEVLTRLDPETGEVIDYEVGTAFGGIAFSPDQEHAVLYHDGSGQEGLYNPSEVAVIAIDEAPSESNPRVLTIQVGGRIIEEVTFVEPMQVVGQQRRLVLFMTEGLLKLIDIDDPALPTVSVKLVTDDDPRTVVPRQVIARPGDGVRDPVLFVRASGSEDIYAISLVERSDGQPGFWASLNQFEGGSQPSDMELVMDGDNLLLLVANSWGQYTYVINVDTADSFTLTLDSYADRVFTRTQDGELEAVFYGSGGTHVYFLAVEGLMDEKGSNLTDLLVPDGMESVRALDDDKLVADSIYSGGIVVIDLSLRLVTRLSSASGYSISNATLYQGVFFIANEGTDRVVSLDLETGHPEPLVLDESVSRFDTFEGVGMGMVVHPTFTGRMTLFPLAEPYRENAFVVDGVWLEGFLDMEEVWK